MANNAFEANDAIGISMTGDATATNVEYKTTAGGATDVYKRQHIGPPLRRSVLQLLMAGFVVLM